MKSPHILSNFTKYPRFLLEYQNIITETVCKKKRFVSPNYLEILEEGLKNLYFLSALANKLNTSVISTGRGALGFAVLLSFCALFR